MMRKTKPSLTKTYIGIILLMFLISFVSAEVSCSFINITQGPEGPEGPQGPAGPAGANGTTPVFGVDYFDGAPGTDGTDGSDGSDGAAATIAVNYTFTGAAGTNAAVTNIGTSAAALFDFTIPRGETGTIPDISQFLFINGTRAMTGMLQMGGYNISNVLDPVADQDAATKKYVDTKSSYNATYDITSTTVANNLAAWNATYNSTYDAALSDVSPGNTTEVLFNYLGEESGDSTFTFNNTSGMVTAPYFVGDGSGLTGVGATAATALTFTAKACSTGTIYKGQAVYISGASGSNPVVCQANNTDTTKSRVVGLMIANTNANAQGSVRRSGVLTPLDTRSSNTNINPLGQTWSAGDLLFATTTGGLTNVRPTSGRSVKVAYSMEGSNIGDTLLAYPMENPVWVTAASTEDIVLRMGDSAAVNKVSFRNYTNTEVAWILSNGTSSFSASNYNATYDAKLQNPIFGYVTLMAGSAMVTTTNPTVMNQWETATNKNNYISLNFTDGGTEVAQWITDFPDDWNSTGNVIFTPVWTASSGSGTANFTIKAKLFPDDAALDTALVTVGTSVDTLTATGDIMVAPATTGAAITSVGTGGNTAIIQVSRDSSQDTLSGTAQLIGLRVKYVTNKA